MLERRKVAVHLLTYMMLLNSINVSKVLIFMGMRNGDSGYTDICFKGTKILEILIYFPVYGANIREAKKQKESSKLERIIKIWQAGKGVICLPIFHNILPAEAFTREAAIIECLGVNNLTNLKRGEYYGQALSYTMRQRRQLGLFLLHKAMKIFIQEGESQLRPDDVLK